MKRIFLSTLMLVVATISVNAQKPTGRQPMKAQQAFKDNKMMMQQLNLSDDQKKKMEAINQDFRSKMQDLNKQENITVKEQRDKRLALIKNRQQQMEAILTPEQKSKMTEFKKERQEKVRAFNEKRLDKMKTELGLSDDQAAKLKSINEKFQSQMEAIKNDKTADRSKKREQFNALQQQHQKDLNALLTPEQQQKLSDMKKTMKEKRMHKGN